MGWADNYIRRLQEGETVRFRPRGNSMSGRIESGQLVTVEPVSLHQLSRNAIVLCRVAGNQYLHLVKQVDPTTRRALIANNRGRENGWTTFDKVYGICTKIEP